MKSWRQKEFKKWFIDQNGTNFDLYIVNDCGEIYASNEEDLIYKIYNEIKIENDCSCHDYSCYIREFSANVRNMVNLYNEFLSGSGRSFHIVNIKNIELSCLLGADTELNFNDLKDLTDLEIKKIYEDDEDIWIVNSINDVLKNILKGVQNEDKSKN